ncbi:hypothetical protein B296_00005509 [Ensete ventricosum]|uniref:Uncharacterized protein n=1 Tax=Ensete ventricosum TaxID=4639 RepID=A0A426ZB00_ENSVE|nr:hypothetical protein B296_00005509 [Ensete ventricosum]
MKLVQSLSRVTLGRINSTAPARSDQFLLGSVPKLLLDRIIPEPRSLRSFPKLLLADDTTQDLIFSTLIRNFEKVFSGGRGGNDMTNIDLAATFSRPRTTGPPTWLTRHGEADLTQAWRNQRLYDRPNTGKVGKVDITQRQARLDARTTDDMVRCNGMVSNKEDK